MADGVVVTARELPRGLANFDGEDWRRAVVWAIYQVAVLRQCWTLGSWRGRVEFTSWCFLLSPEERFDQVSTVAPPFHARRLAISQRSIWYINASCTSEPKHVDTAASTPVAKSKCRAAKRSSSSYPTTGHGMLAMGHSTVNQSSQLNSQLPPHIPAAQFVKQYAARGRRAAVWVCDEAQTIPRPCQQRSGWQRTGGSTGDMRACASPRLHAVCCKT